MYVYFVLAFVAIASAKPHQPIKLGKRCANLFDESCENGGIPGSGGDEGWLGGGDTPGKRCANLFDESCNNGGLPGAGSDESWLGGNTPGKRCANLFDESCNNGGLPGAGSDESWLGGNTPGKRCANLFDESCNNGGLPGAGSDESWLGGNTPGKRYVQNNVKTMPHQQGSIKSLNDFFHRVHMVATKRCANLFDESCNNGGLPGAGDDEGWLGGNTPGKRTVHNNIEDAYHQEQVQSPEGILKSLGDFIHRVQMVTSKRCANLFDESCVNAGLVGANGDEQWLGGGNTPGKRWTGKYFG